MAQQTARELPVDDVARRRRRSGQLDSVRRFCLQKPLGAACGAALLVLLVLGLLGEYIAPYDYDEVNAAIRLQGPSLDHPFGTDVQGRDVLSRVIYGARTSIFIGFATVAIATTVAAVLGMMSGYFGGVLDLLVQRVVDTWQAFPGLIFLLFIVAILGAGIGTLIITMSLLFIAGSSRVVRSQVLAIKHHDYVAAARAVGASDFRIMFRHVLPNVSSIILVDMSGMLAAVILIEASLSFLGLGVPIPYPSWGRMLQESQAQMRSYPYLALFPGLAITVTVYALNMFGDALRDVLDPRLRGQS